MERQRSTSSLLTAVMVRPKRQHAAFLFALTFALTLHLAFADRPLSTDVFTSPCPALADPPPSGEQFTLLRYAALEYH